MFTVSVHSMNETYDLRTQNENLVRRILYPTLIQLAKLKLGKNLTTKVRVGIIHPNKARSRDHPGS